MVQGQECRPVEVGLAEFDVEILTTIVPGEARLEVVLNPGSQYPDNVRGMEIQIFVQKDISTLPIELDWTGSWLNPNGQPMARLQNLGNKLRVEVDRGPCRTVSGRGLVFTLEIGDIPSGWTAEDVCAVVTGGIVIMEEISLRQIAPDRTSTNFRDQYFDLEGNEVPAQQVESGTQKGLLIRRRAYENGEVEFEKVLLY